MRRICVAIGAAAILLANVQPAPAQLKEQQTLQTAARVMDEIMAIHLRGIPQSLLADAEGIAIVPDVLKASLGVGGRHGKGVLIIRDENGQWQLPLFMSITGGNVGWQIGIQSTDLILVFKTKKSIEGILGGKLTLGGDLAVAAGPVGREAAAATDARFKAEIYSYSRSRGLFAGASIDGSVLRIEPDANATFYRWRETAGLDAANDPAMQLVAKIAAYSTGATPEEIVPAEPMPSNGIVPAQPANPGLPQASTVPPGEFTLSPLATTPLTGPPVRAEDFTRDRLLRAADGMFRLLDQNWRAYLALPAELYQPGATATPDAIRATLGNYDAVAADPRYQPLTSRTEFQATHALLGNYLQTLSERAQLLSLPAPPSNSGPNLIVPPPR
ncbi:MAG: lipid-binding SYLF domain-containing protein [Pirellulaceae bacterium]